MDPGSPSRFPSSTWLPEAPDTSGMDSDRSVVRYIALTLSWSPAEVLACPLRLKLTLSTWDVGLEQMCGNAVEGLGKEQLCQEPSLQCQTPSTWGCWHCLDHLLPFWMQRATSILSSTQSVCKARDRTNKIPVRQISRLTLLLGVFCNDFVSLCWLILVVNFTAHGIH